MVDNRKARRRDRVLARKAGRGASVSGSEWTEPTNPAGMRWPPVLLGTTALISLAFAASAPAGAQVILNPPGTIPAQCAVTGGVAVCEGDLSAGLDADGPPFTSVTVQNLTSQIAPAAGADGVNFRISGDSNLNLTIDSGAFGIVTVGPSDNGLDIQLDGNGDISIDVRGGITAGDEGIDATIPGASDGNIVINSVGDISSDRSAIDADVFGNGTVTVISRGNITSARSDGIEAQVGTDGNVIVDSVGRITADSTAIEASVLDNGNVTVFSRGDLTSIQRDAIEVDVLDNGNIIINSIGTLTATGGSFGTGIDAEVLDNGDITIDSTGDIFALDEGIYAEVVLSGNIVIRSTGNITVDNDGIQAEHSGPSGTISITQTGNVTASANGGRGIDVDSSTGAVDSTVTITSGSTITGGSGTGHGVRFVNGRTNRLNNWATIQAASGSAIQGGSGQEQIYNFGTLIGTVNTGANDDLVVLDATGTTDAATFDGGSDIDTFRLNSATTTSNAINGNQITNFEILEKRGASIWTLNGTATFSQSAEIFGGTLAVTGNLVTPVFTNTSGTLNAGGVRTVGTAMVTGNYIQATGGTFAVDVDPTAGTADLVTITGTANVAGLVQPVLINPVTGTRSVTILTATGGTTNNGLGLLASPALQASLSYPNANDVLLSYSIDFSAGGLNPNQAALGRSLTAALANGQGGLEPVLTPLLNNIFTIGDYKNALDQLLPEVYLNTETASLLASEDFIENLFSCRLAGANHTALSEGECLWARPQGRFLDRDSDANTIGFDETSGGLAAGAQIAVAPNWFAGFALGYERASLDTDTGAETDSNRFSGGLSLKYQAGSFLLGAAISGGVSGNDTQRPISFGGAGGFNATADSNYAIKTLTGQARAAYVFQFRDWFAKPLVDVTATYLSRDGVTETGAGAANLIISGSDETFFSITPALEIGGDFALSETSTLRPYVRAGVSFYTDSDHGLSARFVNAPAGTSAFSITSDFDDVFADVAAGATAFFDNGSTLGLSYEGLISSDTQQHGVSLKGTIAF